MIYSRFKTDPAENGTTAGTVHFPNNPDVFDLIEAQQLTAEELVEKYENGKVKLMWDAKTP